MSCEFGPFVAGNHVCIHGIHEYIYIRKDELGRIGNDDCGENRLVHREQVVTHWLPDTSITYSAPVYMPVG